jgi:hypothetical protein
MGAAISTLAVVVDPARLLPGGGWRAELAMLHLLALVLLIAVALLWGRHAGRRLCLASGFVSVSVLTAIYLMTVQARHIPIDWITILHEGLERKSIMHLYARGAHAGGNFAFVLAAIAGGHAPNLHDVVWLNLLLALVNAVIFFHVGLRVTGVIWAIVWTLVFALNPATFLASFSELPTNLLALYFLAGTIAWAVVQDPLGQPRIARAAAYGLCAVLTLLAGLTRLDAALLGAVALALPAGQALAGSGDWSAMDRRLRAGCVRLLAGLDEHPVAVVALCVVGVWLAFAGLPWALAGRSETSGIYPFNPSFLALFVFLPMLALPIGVSIATVFGFIHAIRYFARFGGLALSLFILVRAYFAAENQYFEAGRYLSYVLPAIFLLGLFGKGELEDLARRSWRPNWCRAARVGYLMAWFTLPLPGIAELYARPEYRLDGGFAQLLLDRNTQREVRYLMALTENNPQCVFVGRAIDDRHGDPTAATEYGYVLFGAPLAEPIEVSEKEISLEDLIARYASGAACVRLYYGGDCNLTFGDRCKQFVAGRRLVDEQRFWSRPYNTPLQFGYGAPEIVLATYAWP